MDVSQGVYQKQNHVCCMLPTMLDCSYSVARGNINKFIPFIREEERVSERVPEATTAFTRESGSQPLLPITFSEGQFLCVSVSKG
jgi:hypothetical protein